MDLQIQELTADERALLRVFHQFGRDGRAITVLSLVALSPLRSDRVRLAGAISGLRAKHMIDPCGIDAVTRKPAGYRLVAEAGATAAA